MIDSSAYLRGMNDCLLGVEHRAGKGADYDAGYASQYQHEQNKTALTEGKA
jgi:hypothetical protein